MEAIYKDEMTEETLNEAAKLYHKTVSCPDADPDSVQFYEELFEKFPPETVVVTLVRILSVSKEKRLTVQYRVAKVLLENITRTFQLRYTEIAAATTPAAELTLYPELSNITPPLGMLDSGKSSLKPILVE